MRRMAATLVVGVALALTAGVQSAAAQAPDGQALYSQHCRKCHGATGTPTARMAEMYPELKALNSHVEQKTVLGEDELRRQRIAGRLLLARADAGTAIGFGHVARTGALLEAWVELGGSAELVGTGIGGKARGLAASRHAAKQHDLPRMKASPQHLIQAGDPSGQKLQRHGLDLPLHRAVLLTTSDGMMRIKTFLTCAAVLAAE